MIIMDVMPKEIHVLLDLTFTEVNHILNVLDNATIDPKCDPESMAFVTQIFIPKLDELTGEK
jgi:hypothetical protein